MSSFTDWSVLKLLAPNLSVKKKRMKTFFFLVFYLNITLPWWLFREDSDNDDDTTNKKTPQNNGVLVPFEIASTEQKFLQEAKQLLDLSLLDQCQHKVSNNVL